MAKDERQKAFEREWKKQSKAMDGRAIIPDFMALGRAAGFPGFGGGGGKDTEDGPPTNYKPPMNPAGRPNSKAPPISKVKPGGGKPLINSIKPLLMNPNSPFYDASRDPVKHPRKPPAVPGAATQAMPKPTAIRPATNSWQDVVSAYFPKTGGNVYKEGGLVRGGGAAQRGRGRGKMC